MPKKHAPSYLHAKPSYVHPSLQSSRSPPPSSSAEPRTVNQRIAQLRREQTPRATPERRDEVTEVVTARTVPPELRRILHMAEVDAPPPKPGTRTRRTGARPPPGPAAPSSWLHGSRHAIARARHPTSRHGDFCALARANDAEYKRLPSNRSLIHHALQTFALHWEELAEYEQHHLPTLPIPLKEALLSYLSLHGAGGCVDFRSFKILFQSQKEVDGATGSDLVRFLDLSGLLGQDFTLGDLHKCLQRPVPSSASVTDDIAGLSMASPKGRDKAPVEIAESWEDETEAEAGTAPPTGFHTPFFPNLTRLSLAHPGPWASWADLLALSSRLNTLTHLSLAHWPRPSTTPNATTTSMVSKHATVSLGGSHFYSELDDDWHEAANILRRLSLNTYCLQWLDLEGCTWHKALTWGSPDRGGRVGNAVVEDEWVRPTTSPGPDWNAAWRQVDYLNLSQGWVPENKESLQKMPAGVVQAQLLRWLREKQSRERVQGKLDTSTGHEVAEWVEREKTARSVGREVQQQRKAGGGGRWCVVDHGWGVSS